MNFLASLALMVAAAAGTPTPGDGAQLSEAPATIVVDFDSALTAGTSTGYLSGPGGSLSLGAGVDVDADTVAFSVTAPLVDGEWELRWSALTAAGEVVEGESTFLLSAGNSPVETLPPAEPADQTVIDDEVNSNAQLTSAYNELMLLGIIPVVGLVAAMIGYRIWRRRRDRQSRWIPGGSHSSYLPPSHRDDDGS